MGKGRKPRSKRRPEMLPHLSKALGADVIRSLGTSSAIDLEVVRQAVEEGIPSSAVAVLQQDLTDLHLPRPSEYVDAIASRATRARRERLTPEQGERLVRIAGVIVRTLEVWEDVDDAADFLTTPHPLLGGDTPLDRATGELGARQVEDILVRLDLGLPV